MKKRVIELLSICLVLSLIYLPSEANANVQATYYVSPAGSDSNPGTIEQPFATLHKARDIVRTINSNMTGDIIVYLRGGTYHLTDTVIFSELDSGSNGYKVKYRSYPGEIPIVSGGSLITGWTQVPNSPLWSAPVSVDNFRQLYVNGQRAERTRSQQTYTGLGWSKGAHSNTDGIYVSGDTIGNYENAGDIELIWLMYWRVFYHNVSSIANTAGNEKIINMRQPYFNWGTEIGNDGGISYRPNYSTPFYIENAFELLDSPGEFYLNRSTDTVYYWPDGEDMSTAEVYAPKLETLLAIQGSTIEDKVHDIDLEGITFRHGTWLRPSEMGFANQQAQVIASRAGNQRADHADNDMIPGNILIDSAYDIGMYQSVFEHMGAAAIHLRNGVEDVSIVGNYFNDIADSAIVVGLPTHDAVDEANEEVNVNNIISNNLIRYTGQDYYSAPAISAFYTDGLQITHNDIAETPYSGVSLGWGWSYFPDSTTSRNNVVSNNKISDFNQILKDGGGIYTLGQQPDSVISGNYIRNQTNINGAIYPDEGSAYFTITDNVVENVHTWMFIWHPSIHDITVNRNYTTAATFRNHGTNTSISNTTVVPDMNWPIDAREIIQNSGLQEAYYGLYANLANDPRNVALGKPASSYDAGGNPVSMIAGYEADKAVDGDPLTWAQASSEYIWAQQVDLQQTENVSTIAVQFPNQPPASQSLFATQFQIKGSLDSINWSTLAIVTDGTGGRAEVKMLPKPIRYIRVEAIKPDGPGQTGGQMAIAEIEAYTEANLARGKTASAYYLNGSVASMQPGQDAYSAVDGNSGTFAQATGQYKWVQQVDMQYVTDISKVIVHFSTIPSPGLFATEYAIKTSLDAINWSTAAVVLDGKVGENITEFMPKAARYVRIEAIKPDGPSQIGGQMAIAELEVYGFDNLARDGVVSAYYMNGSAASMHAGREANKAIDGNPATWAQASGQYKWAYQVDLLSAKPISTVIVNFPVNPPASETLYATEYKILTSLDGINWTNAGIVTESAGGRSKTVLSSSTLVRFVKIEAVKPDGAGQTGGQMAIAELEIYEHGEAPLFNPTHHRAESGGNKLWLMADTGVTRDDDGYVSNWAGMALYGNGNDAGVDASQSVQANKPKLIENAINGKPAIRFDGNDDFMDAVGAAGDMDNFTMAFVLKPIANKNYNQSLGALGSWGQFQFHGSANGGVYAGTSTASRISPADGAGAGTIELGEAQLFVYSLNDGVAKLYKNGTLLATKTVANPANWTGFRIGNASGQSIDGDLAEIIIYRTALSDSARISIEQYLTSKYGL